MKSSDWAGEDILSQVMVSILGNFGMVDEIGGKFYFFGFGN